jgi:hypothetical protein
MRTREKKIRINKNKLRANPPSRQPTKAPTLFFLLFRFCFAFGFDLQKNSPNKIKFAWKKIQAPRETVHEKML